MIQHGHGPLENILNHYTLAHVNKFLQEIDSRARQDYIRSVVAHRISQLAAKDFRQEIRRLQQQDRQIRAMQARAEGRRLHLEPNEEEAEFLDRQRHDYVSDWSDAERERFNSERDKMWAMIPPEFRERAEQLAKGGY